jgi:hypothetical protein
MAIKDSAFVVMRAVPEHDFGCDISSMSYVHQRRLVSISKQNTIVFASCRNLLTKEDSTNILFNRIYVTDLLSMHKLNELWHDPSSDIVCVDCHPSLPYFMMGDIRGHLRLWSMKETLDHWAIIYEQHLDGAILSSLWAPLECQVKHYCGNRSIDLIMIMFIIAATRTCQSRTRRASIFA